MQQSQSVLTKTEISAALAFGIVGLLILGLQPIVLGELVSHKLLTLQGLGIVAMAEIIALGLGVLLGDAMLPLTQMRKIATITVILVAALDLAASWCSGTLLFGVDRAASGLAEGVLVWIATCSIVRSGKPDKVAGVFLTTQTIAQALVAGACALFLVPHFGWKAGFVAPGALALFLLTLVSSLRPELRRLTEDNSGPVQLDRSKIAVLAVVFLQMSAIGSLWPYLEPIGTSFNLAPTFLEALVSAVLVFQIIGGFLATISVERAGTIWTIVAVGSTQALLALPMFYAGRLSALGFSILWALFGALWLFAMPFHVRLAMLADPSGRVAMLVPAMQLLGTAFGPFCAALLVSDSHPRITALMTCAFAACAVITLLIFVRNPRRKVVSIRTADEMEL